LDIWKKHAMNMFMIQMHHHLLLQNPREREARKYVTIVPSNAAEQPQEQPLVADPL
jgi:hypothetical protein